MDSDELKAYALDPDSTREEIQAFATKEALVLPDDYLEFLVEYGGIQFPGPTWVYAMGDGKGGLIQRLDKYDEIYTYATPCEADTYVYKFAHVVIGSDLSGDEIILISEAGPHYGAVYGWEHEAVGGLLEEPYEEVIEELNALATGNEQIEALTRMEAWFHEGDSFTGFLKGIKKSS